MTNLLKNINLIPSNTILKLIIQTVKITNMSYNIKISSQYNIKQSGN